MKPMLEREEAAKYLRVSLSTFERNVQPYLALVRVGRGIAAMGGGMTP